MRGQSETISGNFRDPLVFYKQGKNDWWTMTAGQLSRKLKEIADKEGSGWEKATRDRAQEHANSGMFVVACDSDHIAVVSPGKAGVRKIKDVNYTCPAIAQQGGQGDSKNYLYGITERETMSWSWGPEALPNVLYYVYVKKRGVRS
ncbi:MAG: hypothetical protein GXY86_05220 [Firmicutes bacterium]|nr:hypothetical protein [Bacillota bacterium]